ncbi:MAG: 4-(cytidine 5'-diphospho)-2-C-methyl-D-erythritol kinase [Elusimicrobiota bacterium]|nr:4-(cytidine 5'-diphospho)-2-C-methyl-D-erythritol kinase [Elusimicrobiota bacterium]
MKLKANAKINLFLDILNKRKDGYHNIKTIFQEISLSDDIFINECSPRLQSGVSEANSIKIVCDNPEIPTDKRNLVYKAADAIKKYSGVKKRVLIKIKKRIPAGAGLGGGSSDAAAVLRGLNKLWNLKLTKNQLVKIGKEIGADVPFFLYGGRCLGEGIGDKLTPLKIRKKEWYVLVKPQFEISTKNVYLRLTKPRKTDKITRYINRLEDVVIPLYPEIKKIKDLLTESGAEFSLMSGSGSCVFGLIKNRRAGEKIKNKMKKAGYAVWLVHSVGAIKN